MTCQILLCLLLAATGADPGDATRAGRFVVEHPTLLNLGFEWEIQGDANRDATVAVRFRAAGETVDAGVPIPTVNDGYTGRAPDLGALEVGKPEPGYGPRWLKGQRFYR
jgi:hypothetical protein